jgi:hypothetical protein
VPYDGWYDSGGEASRRAAADREHQQREQADADRAAYVREWPAAVRAAEGGDVTAMRRVGELNAQRHNQKIIICTKMPSGVGAYFDWSTNTAYVPPMNDCETLAIWLHEQAHGAAGPCPQIEPHRRDPSVRAWWCCLACETAAWKIAAETVPFSREMFARLQGSLSHYRRQTPGSFEAVAALDRVSGTVFLAESRLTHLKRRMREERQASVNADIERDRIRARIQFDRESHAFNERMRMRQESRR